MGNFQRPIATLAQPNLLNRSPDKTHAKKTFLGLDSCWAFCAPGVWLRHAQILCNYLLCKHASIKPGPSLQKVDQKQSTAWLKFGGGLCEICLCDRRYLKSKECCTKCRIKFCMARFSLSVASSSHISHANFSSKCPMQISHPSVTSKIRTEKLLGAVVQWYP